MGQTMANGASSIRYPALFSITKASLRPLVYLLKEVRRNFSQRVANLWNSLPWAAVDAVIGYFDSGDGHILD